MNTLGSRFPHDILRLRKALCLLCLLPLSAFGESYSGTAVIVDNDVDRARNEAIRDVLWEAGTHSNMEVKTSSALIQGDVSEVAVFNSAFRLKQFAITREEISGNRLHIDVSLDREETGSATCDNRTPLRVVGYEWRGLVNPGVGDDDRILGSQLVGDALHERISESLGAYLLPQKSSSKPLYKIAVSMQRSSKNAWSFSAWGTLRISVTGDDGNVLAEEQLPIESGDFAVRVVQNLGYATLRKWRLTDTAEDLLNRASIHLTQQVKCLPAVVRIPATNPDGSFNIETEFASALIGHSLFFFSDTWPLQRGGGLDLMSIEGVVQPRLESHNTLEFPAKKKLPGRKYPNSGGYLVIQ